MNNESEELAFIAEDVKALAKDSIESTLRNQEFKAAMINQWCSSIIEEMTKRLCALNKPFKYITSCVIMQKTGAGLHLATSTFWDQTTDSSTTVRWENTTMYAILSVYGVII
jgi:dynein light chain Tctex-type 1